MMLIEPLVQRRNLALAKGVVENVVDRCWRNSKTGSSIAIDDDSRLQALGLLARIHILQAAILFQLVEQEVGPVTQLIEIAGLQRILELGAAHAAADTDILHRNEKNVQPGNLRQLRTQAANNLIGAELAIAHRLEGDKTEALVDGRAAAPAPNKRAESENRRIIQNDFGRALLQRGHGFEG